MAESLIAAQRTKRNRSQSGERQQAGAEDGEGGEGFDEDEAAVAYANRGKGSLTDTRSCSH
ncbi:hypothetical protein OR16_35070 [Cupriavidus basilensis OR16]|uniref:Uncharacterized protein n=1 Tax=Cupriavidus basilensis OR16 TaxID=1127483 RepID=H1SF99_9BURK|nr:hypothetical protein [Cupriavidus basilensis]EHP38763.1 hypothetical protein OR16_35070 [Cupriavidus basilensis OR16]